jgi:hypothetical protein
LDDARLDREAVVGTALIDYNALKFAKAYWWEIADRWRKLFPPNLPEAGVRACVAFCAQYFLEQCVIMLLERAIPQAVRAGASLDSDRGIVLQRQT